jgi:hypothetical protein
MGINLWFKVQAILLSEDKSMANSAFWIHWASRLIWARQRRQISLPRSRIEARTFSSTPDTLLNNSLCERTNSVALVRKRTIPTASFRRRTTIPEVPVSIPGATKFLWEVVGLERCPLSLVNTIEELLGRNSSGSGLENREYGHEDSLRWPRNTLYPQKLALSLRCEYKYKNILILNYALWHEDI